ncbi:MAG: hypothetical protein B7C24_13795 [Bacteroidetes bacterium 4572_77]|nr:MAG: hypothetical protein B7C24_13795 [Bacteroidetes bacterium 4572_77]
MESSMKPHILIVDDDQQNLVSMAGALQHLPIIIDIAKTAKRAIYYINKQKYALLIFDVHMPKTDGFQLADIIKSGYHNHHTPIIFVSGVFFDEFSIFKGYKNGAVDYLTKPLNMDILESKVKVFLDLEGARSELEQARNQVQKTLENKTLFLGKVSHEIRNPLGLINSILEQMEDDISPKDREEYMGILKSSTKHMNRLLDDLVDFSQMEIERISLENKPFNIRKEIRYMVDAFSISHKKSNNKFVCIFPEEIPERVVGDVTRYKQIIINLLGNANKFTEKGTITIKIELIKLSNKKIVLRTDISDTGMGMSKKEMTQLFIPFSQSRRDIYHKYGGSGLGLAIAKKLSEMMGGGIEVSSVKGKGSVFSFFTNFEQQK